MPDTTVYDHARVMEPGSQHYPLHQALIGDSIKSVQFNQNQLTDIPDSLVMFVVVGGNKGFRKEICTVRPDKVHPLLLCA